MSTPPQTPPPLPGGGHPDSGHPDSGHPGGSPGSGQPSGPPGGRAPHAPAPPPGRGRRPLIWVAAGCVAVLLLIVVLGVTGAGAWLLLRDPGGGPTTTTAPQDPRDEPTEGPTDEPTHPADEADEAPDDPTDEPTAEPMRDDPTDDPADEPSDDGATTSLTLRIISSAEVEQVETGDGPLEPTRGAFVGVEIELDNESDEEIGLAGENFTFYDEAGDSHHVRYGRFSTTGPQVPPGETATALVYADVEPGTEITQVSYTDEVGTGGQEVRLPID